MHIINISTLSTHNNKLIKMILTVVEAIVESADRSHVTKRIQMRDDKKKGDER